jgi:DNA polymerase elongation subunit (family B)
MMQEYYIDCTEAANDFIDYLREDGVDTVKVDIGYDQAIIYLNDGNKYIVLDTFMNGIDSVLTPEPKKISSQYDNDLIFGKNKVEKITSVEVVDDKIHMFKNDGTVETMDQTYWLLGSRPMGKDTKMLAGNCHYKYQKSFNTEEIYKKAKGYLFGRKADIFSLYDTSEAAMVYNGITLFKGLKVNEVSVLSFDIETTGVAHDENSKVLMISNTFRDINGKITKKLFSIDDYEDDIEMINRWCDWVKKTDPSIMIGHNIFGFDLPYLSYRMEEYCGLSLGKDGSNIKFAQRPSKFRKDGSQSYDYFNAKIFGRQIIDTFFLSIKYDFSRKYDSYGLKQIIEQEGLEKKGRIKWDFETHRPQTIYNNLMANNCTCWGSDGDCSGCADHFAYEVLWNEFKEYAIDDADDALKLYDLMIPSYFYYMQSLPMPFQTMNNTATGRQINNFLIRSYLQEGHSIPKASDRVPYQGAISFGMPGLYAHVNKVDVASLYPSIMITEKIYDPEKDPNAHFYKMVKFFTEERLKNKALGKETGDRYYKDMEQAQKIVINSAYGLLGTSGLNYNYFAGADKVTATGREIIQKGIDWVCGKQAIQKPKLLKSGKPETYDDGTPKLYWTLPDGPNSGREFQIVNVDTDSFSYTTGKKLSEDEFKSHINEINALFKDGIRWEDDGYYDKVLVVKTKNYVLVEGKKIKIKGSGLKGTMKEKALQDFMNDVILLLLKKRRDHIYSLYMQYANEIKDITDMTRWAMKKTITKAVLEPQRKQEQNVFDAIKDVNYQEGDKFRMFYDTKDTLKLVDEFNGTYDHDSYFKKLHETLCIFETLIDPSLFPNFKVGRNKELL